MSGKERPIDELRISVQVQPNASRNEIVSFTEGLLKVKLTAPPVDGKANAALIAVLAEKLGVRKSQVRILSGLTSRKKVVAVEGLSAEDAQKRLP